MKSKPRTPRKPTTTGVITATSGKDREGFETDVRRVLEQLRRALGRTIERMPGRDKAAELRRTLDLDAALAWQIHTIATGEDVLRSGRVVPKGGAMERFLRAAGDFGVAEEVVDAARAAYAEFERVVRVHAEDRQTFEAMLASLGPEDGATLLRTRRAAFKASAAVWGVSVRCMVNTVIYHQRASGEFDCLCVRGRVGVRGLNPHAGVAIYASSRTWGGSAPPPEGSPSVLVDGCELIEGVCSSPLPKIERQRLRDGTVRDFLTLDGLGRQSEATVFWRSLSSNFMGGTRQPPHGCSVLCTEPTETLLMDLLVPRGWSDPRSAQVRVTPADNGAPMPSGTGVRTPSLPFEGMPTHATSVEALYSPELPVLSEVVRSELEARRWDPAGFDVYRCVVRYPVMHAMVHLWAGGPEE